MSRATAVRWLREAKRRGFWEEGEGGGLSVRYLGPHEEVAVRLPGVRERRVRRGCVVELPAEYALVLLDDEGSWAPAAK